MIRLNLGCGDDKREGYINADLYNENADAKFDAAKIPYDDNTVDEIFASHIIEHFHFQQSWEVLREWYRVLKPGGFLKVETPDFHNSCRAFIESNDYIRYNLYSHFFSEPWKPGHTHYFLYTEPQLSWQLSMTGFVNIRRIPPESSYFKRPGGWAEHLYLHLIAYKKIDQKD
jgi:SAM-dependent methyltransferase